MLPECITITDTISLCQASLGLTYFRRECTDAMIAMDSVRSAAYVLAPERQATLPAKRRRLYLVRHGETDWNIAGRFQGREDNPMNERGMAQAVHCSERLREAFALGEVQIGAVFASPLQRAYSTGVVIATRCGLPKPIATPEIIERDYGPLSGLTPAQRREKYPCQSTEEIDGVERMGDAGQRLAGAVERLCVANPASNLLLVLHGGILNAFINLATGGKIGTGITLTTNCCINVLSNSHDGSLTLEAFNLTPDDFVSWMRHNK